MKILIVKYGALGDVVRTSYILRGIVEKYSNVSITWLTSKVAKDLLRFNHNIDNILTEDCNFKKVFDEEFDLVLSLDDELEILKKIEKLNYKNWFGAYLLNEQVVYSENSSLWFDMGLISKFGKEKADKLKKENVLEHNEIFAKMLDIKVNNIFYGNIKYEENFKQKLSTKFYNIGINSGSGGRWESKKLSIEHTIALIYKLLSKKINDKDVCVYLLGGEDEKERNMMINNRFENENRVKYLGEFRILEFAALIKNLDYLISSDSLALHLAIAQKIKNLSFYAPTSAQEIGTFGTGIKIKSTAEDYCSYKKDADNTTITVERICNAFYEHLELED